MARIETRRTVLLPAGIFYWNGTSSPARGGTPFLVARRFGALPCGRGAFAALHRGGGWATGPLRPSRPRLAAKLADLRIEQSQPGIQPALSRDVENAHRAPRDGSSPSPL